MASPVTTPVTTALDHGSAQFAAAWRIWRRQWTQPQLLKIADAYLGARLFHSSQMSGFEKRRLQNPAPKAFVCIGYLNLAHARSLGIDAEMEVAPDIGLPSRLPDHLADLWRGREPLRDAKGTVLGPCGLFAAFSGLLELSNTAGRFLAPEEAAEAAQALGRYLRLTLGARGTDWLSELSQLETQCDAIKPLLLGQPITAERIQAALPRLALLAKVSEDELWAVAQPTVTLPN